MKNQVHISNHRLELRAETSQPTYLGYINGKLTKFFIKHIPATNEYIKVAL